MKRLLAIAIVLCAWPHAAVRAEFSIKTLQTDVFTAGSLNQLIGWEFTPKVDISVTKLGFFDFLQDGFATSHDVGLYEVESGSLLASRTLAAGTVVPLEGPSLAPNSLPNWFRYAPITPTTLLANRNYVIAATNHAYADPTPDNTSNSLLETADEILYVQRRVTLGTPPVLALPVLQLGADWDIGPAFQFTIIPEPSTYALAAIGVIGLLAFRGRTQRK